MSFCFVSLLLRRTSLGSFDICPSLSLSLSLFLSLSIFHLLDFLRPHHGDRDGSHVSDPFLQCAILDTKQSPPIVGHAPLVARNDTSPVTMSMSRRISSSSRECCATTTPPFSLRLPSAAGSTGPLYDPPPLGTRPSLLPSAKSLVVVVVAGRGSEFIVPQVHSECRRAPIARYGGLRPVAKRSAKATVTFRGARRARRALAP